MRIIVRAYGDGKLILEEPLELASPDELELIAHRHVGQLTGYELHAIEIEFPDHSDPNQRFLRFGTDKRRMVCPVLIYRGGSGEQPS